MHFICKFYFFFVQKNKYSDAQAKLIAEDILAHVQGAVLLMQLNKKVVKAHLDLKHILYFT